MDGESSAVSEEATVPTAQFGGTQSPVFVPAATPVANQIVSLPESRLLTFEYPAGIRVGDSDILRLALLLDDDQTLTPTILFEEHEIQSQGVMIENLYSTHLVRAEARLDLAGAEVLPIGTIMQRMLPGEPVEFSWSISPNSEGTIRGSVWMYIRYLPLVDGEGEELEKLIFTQPLEIRSLNLFGIGGTPARILGFAGILISSLLGIDDLIRIGRKIFRI
jgi:hypothetical protein